MGRTIRTIRNFEFSDAKPFLYSVFLALMVLLGGASAEWLGLHALMALFALIGLVIICVRTDPKLYTRSTQIGLAFFLAVMALALIQIFPWPESVWSSWADRDEIQKGFRVKNLDGVMMPISMFPGATVKSASSFILPFFTFLLFSKINLKSTHLVLLWTIPLIAAGSAVLGFAQIYLGRDTDLYFYTISNFGSPVGIFSNVNHQATLMLIAIPFLFGLARRYVMKIGRSDSEVAVKLLVFILATIVLAGLVAAGSLAGYLISVPIIIASFVRLLYRRDSTDIKQKLAWVGVSAAFGGIIFLVLGNFLLSDFGVTSFDKTPVSRLTINEVSMRIFADHWGLGTGLGAFQDVYRLHEDAHNIMPRFANHAHNDFLEWAIETGFPGLILLFTFIFWWGKHALQNLRNQRDEYRHIKIAASLALAAILLHSFVDYPLRTPAIAVLGAFCLAITVRREEIQKTRQVNSSKNIVI